MTSKIYKLVRDLENEVELLRGNNLQLTSAAKGSPKLSRDLMWCKECEEERRVRITQCLQSGRWPKCCNQIMTIDAPGERIEP